LHFNRPFIRTGRILASHEDFSPIPYRRAGTADQYIILLTSTK
jgi:hypothetical protein